MRERLRRCFRATLPLLGRNYVTQRERQRDEALSGAAFRQPEEQINPSTLRGERWAMWHSVAQSHFRREGGIIGRLNTD
jgi:hypothetical protein